MVRSTMDSPPISFARAADGVRLAYATSGSPGAPPLIQLPGVPFGNLEAEWGIPVAREAYGLLAGRVRLVQFDGRGSGRSQRDVDDLSFEAMVDDIGAVARACGLRRFALLGFYHSVTHAIAYAARHPEQVTHLVLFGGATRGWVPMSSSAMQALLSLIDQDWSFFAESAAHAWLGWPSDAEGRLMAEWIRTSTTPAVAKRVLQLASAVDVTSDLGNVRATALVLHRRDSPVVPLETSRSLAAGLPDARLEILDGRSGSLFFEHTAAAVEAVATFVAGPASPAADRVARTPAGRPRARDLTGREREVLRHIAAGDTNFEIAAALGISENTVERHAANLYRKIDARGRAEAAAYAVRNGLA